MSNGIEVSIHRVVAMTTKVHKFDREKDGYWYDLEFVQEDGSTACITLFSLVEGLVPNAQEGLGYEQS